VRHSLLGVAISALVGIGLGALSGQILFGGSAWNVIPWAAVACAIGIVMRRLGAAVAASVVYGYLLVAVFLFAANTSSTALVQRVLFSLALGLVGPVCSIPITLVTRWIRLRVRPHGRP